MNNPKEHATENDPATDEYLDVVNEHDEIIGRELRSVIYREHISNFRVVNAFVKNTAGKLWTPQRSDMKDLFPGALDFSMGEHVKSGESYDDAFERGLSEELRITKDKVVNRLLGKLSPQIHGVSAFMRVYEIDMEQTPHYNPNDFRAGFWLSPRELLSMISQGTPTKEPDLRIAVNAFYKDSLI